MADRILSNETKDITDELTKHLENEGIEILTNASVKNVEQANEYISIELENRTFNVSHLVIATGRKANTENLNLENIGIATARKGFIKVNEQLKTGISDVYAIGDVNTFSQFVYTAAYEGGIAVANAFQGAEQKVDYSSLPWVIFTDPQIAGVGMDEQEAEKNNIPYEITVLPLTEVPRNIAALDTRGFIRLIKNPDSDLLLGARIVAPEGSELTMELTLALKYKIPIKELISTLHPYLTLSEGIKLAAMSFTTDLNKMSCFAS